MPVAQTVGDMAWIILFGLGFGLLALALAFIIWNIWSKKKKEKDIWREIYAEMVHLAKLNVPDHMKFLYRVPLPFMGDYVSEIKSERENERVLEELRDIFSTHSKSVFLGDIVGFNRIDLILTIEDIIMPKGKRDDPLTDEKRKNVIDEREVRELLEAIKKCGRYLNFIVYKPKKKGILNFPQEEGILAFEDNCLGLTSEDGILTLLGQGLEKLSYFTIPSGYPERMRLLLTTLIERGWIRWAVRGQSMLEEVTSSAMNMDAAAQKAMMMGFATSGGGGGNRRSEPPPFQK